MLPGSILAGIFLLALIPGWVFLRASDDSRHPRHQSGLQESLELAASGLLTTGVAVGIFAVTWPTATLELLQPPGDGQELRRVVVALLAALGLAVGLALLGAFVVRRLASRTTTTSVWQHVLEKKKVPSGFMPHVAVALTNDCTVDGVLSHYTWSSEAAHRDLALRFPIRITTDGKVIKPPYDHLIVRGDEVRTIALKYVRDPSQSTPPDRRWAGLREGLKRVCQWVQDRL